MKEILIAVPDVPPMTNTCFPANVSYFRCGISTVSSPDLKSFKIEGKGQFNVIDFLETVCAELSIH